MTMQQVLDKLFGCELKEQVGYVLEERAIWRETVQICERCGLVAATARRRLRADEFWEDDALYTVPFAERS
jgi:hypothetical protein